MRSWCPSDSAIIRHGIRAFILGLLAATVYCGASGRARPNIVLVVIDTLRPDHLPCYGYGRNTAPFLSSLAERGTVFERTRATSSWTAPSTASLFTSLYPTQHGVREGFRAAQVRQQGRSRLILNAVPEEAETIAEVLKRAGYATFAVTDNININPVAGFGQGFDRFWYTNDAGAATVTARLKEQLATFQRQTPYYLYIHYMDPHHPYRQWPPWYQADPDPVRDQKSAYDSEIRTVDTAIAEAFQIFGWDRNTLLLVTADHGEEFMEHGGWDHGRTLYEEVLRVPLVVFSSADTLKTGRVSQPASLLDVLPTLREYTGQPPSARDQGLSLLPTLRGSASLPGDRAFFADLQSAPWRGSQTWKSVTRGDFKFIRLLPEHDEIFDLAADPGERQGLASRDAAEAAEAWNLIRKSEASWSKCDSVTAPFDLELEGIEKLRSLGYLN